MTGNIRNIRPAGAAIAAVLALSSPTLVAQTATPPLTPEATASPAPQSFVASPAFAPTQPVVQPTPSVDERLNAAITASEMETAAKPAPVTKAASKKAVVEKRRADRPAPFKAAAPAKLTTAPGPLRSEPARASVETTPPAETQAAPALPAEPPAQPNEVQNPAIDPALLWAVGGGVLLLLGLASIAMMRRRNREDDDVLELSQAAPVEPPVIREVAKPAPMPLMTPPPAVREPVQLDPAMQGDIEARLDAMVAAAPSPENPFKTYAKRMTRAKFLLAQQEKAQATPTMTDTTDPVARRTAAVHTQTVYRFGSDRPGRKTLFNPRPS